MKIPGYIVNKQIGKGGMAKVYLALHEGLDRQVAIKVMNRQMDDDDSDFSDRFMREARIVANLTHQNIVTVYDVGKHDGYHYIAMEYLPGGITLDHKIKDGYSIHDGLLTIKQVAAALSFAHSKDIVHRDIKPENIMYREDGSAVLTDFGIAKATTSATKMTATGTVIGTPHYMSPEQAQGQDVGAFSDIYSLGVVFHEILTGKVPYDAESSIAIVFKHITEDVPALSDDLAEYQPILDRMMAKTRDERYENCDQIIDDINGIIGGGAASNATVINKGAPISKGTVINKAAPIANRKQTQQSKKPKSKLIPALAVGAAAAIALIVGGYFYSEQLAEEEQLALQGQQEKTKQAELQAQLKKQKDKTSAEEKRKLAELKIKQKQDSQKAAALTKQQEREAQLAAKQKAEKDAKATAKNAAAKAAADKAWKEKQAKINKLLATADSQLQKTQLDNAYTTYKSALRLDSKNKRARSGITRVASQHLSKANVAAAGYDFDTTNKHISTVIKIAPSHSKLAATQEKVFEYKNEQLVKKAETTRQKEQEQQASTQTTPTTTPEPEKPRRSFGGF